MRFCSLARSIVVAATAGALALPLAAQTQTASAPPCSNPEHRQFDFWIGEWEVQDSTGKILGHNTISRTLNGCALHEDWTSASSGYAGNSYNLYDATQKQWHQTWVDTQGTLLQLDGEFKNGKMILTGETIGQNGSPILNRITWEPLAESRVRQLWESSSDHGETWRVLFDGIYIKKNQ